MRDQLSVTMLKEFRGWTFLPDIQKTSRVSGKASAGFWEPEDQECPTREPEADIAEFCVHTYEASQMRHLIGCGENLNLSAVPAFVDRSRLLASLRYG